MKFSKNFPKVSPEEFAKARDTLHMKSMSSDYKKGYKNGYKKGKEEGFTEGYNTGYNLRTVSGIMD